MKMHSLYAALVAVVAFALSACGGGGGGGGGDTPAATITTVTVKCPDGSTPPATGTAGCPTVGPTAPVTFSTVTPHMFKQGLTIQFNGALDPNSVTSKNVVLWLGAVNTGTAVAGTSSLAAGNKDLTYVATQWLANGQAYNLVISINDSLGRPVQLTIPFTTTAMVCVDNAIWSNPATFSTVLQDCIAPIGVQTLVNTSFNTLQDATCTITVGAPLTAACKAYLANGTMILANTSLVVNGHATLWMAYLGTDNSSNLVLLDANDQSNLVPLGTLILPGPLVWIIGNPSGANMDLSAGSVLRNEQATWITSSSSIGLTCKTNC